MAVHEDVSVETCINTIRCLCIDMTEKAAGGHPGAPLGLAPTAFQLFTKFMKFNPGNPQWPNRDRFVLSNGHACALQYTLLHLLGYDRPTLEDLKQLRQLDSVTPGHPENLLLPGIEVSTGPLGQGVANGVGLALSEAHLAAEFNESGFNIVDNYTFVMCGDGCMQEGLASEASSLAGHLKLSKLIMIYDSNHTTIDGPTDFSFSENVMKRFEAYGWHVQLVEDGNANLNGIADAIQKAKDCRDKPSFIQVNTTIGYGSSKEGTAETHGAALGPEDAKATKEKFGFKGEEIFVIPEPVKNYFASFKERGIKLEREWNELFQRYEEKYPDKASEFRRRKANILPDGWEKALSSFKPEDGEDATRNSSGLILNYLADIVPELIGGSADLTPSNKTKLEKSSDFQAGNRQGRYLRFGVREHAMAAMCNGIAAYGGLIPFCATFLNFTAYAFGAMRLGALSGFRVIYVATHDSIGFGGDGPTHQPIEMLTAFRAVPNFYVYRPADGNEVAGSYKIALEMTNTPSLIALTRQKVPNLKGTSNESVAFGAYVLRQAKEQPPKVILVATGSEVHVAVGAAEQLNNEGITTNVVSMPCWELFDKQDIEYKRTIFPENVPVMSLEAASREGWAKYSHFQLSVNEFGRSGGGDKVMEYFGFTPENAAQQAKDLINFYKEKTVPWLLHTPFNFNAPKPKCVEHKHIPNA